MMYHSVMSLSSVSNLDSKTHIRTPSSSSFVVKKAEKKSKDHGMPQSVFKRVDSLLSQPHGSIHPYFEISRSGKRDNTSVSLFQTCVETSYSAILHIFALL
jgi:hypothetical protein